MLRIFLKIFISLLLISVSLFAITTTEEKNTCNEVNAIGCADLGALYQKGQGVKQDCIKAIDLYTKSCDAGFTTGCFNLGFCYKDGQCIKKDDNKAILFYEKACDGGLMNGCKKYKLLDDK